MRLLAWVALTAALPKIAWARFIDSFPVRTVEKKGFSFDPASGLLERSGAKAKPYTLKVDGLVVKKLELTYEDLLGLAQVDQTSDFHCVEGWSVADLAWGGFRPKEILDMAGLKDGASHVVFHALGETGHKPDGLDHYVESFPLAEVMDPSREMILALRLNGQPLPLDHGAPLRLISPYDLAYKSIKFVERLEITDAVSEGWWTRANPIYPVKAPVPEGRLRRKPAR